MKAYAAADWATASGAEGTWFFTAGVLRGAGFDAAFLPFLGVGPVFFAAAVTGDFGPVDFFTAFEARTAWAAPRFLAGDAIPCRDSASAADLPGAFAATFLPGTFPGSIAATAGAATEALGDDGCGAAADVFFALAFVNLAPDLICLDAIDSAGTFLANDAATDTTGAGAAPPAKLSSVRPPAMALRSHAGLGPRPPHWLPCPSLNFAPLAAAPRFPFAAFAFVAFEAEGATETEVEANFRSPAVMPYLAIVSLIFAMAPLASMASCFWAEAWSAAISRSNWA